MFNSFIYIYSEPTLVNYKDVEYSYNNVSVPSRQKQRVSSSSRTTALPEGKTGVTEASSWTGQMTSTSSSATLSMKAAGS